MVSTMIVHVYIHAHACNNDLFIYSLIGTDLYVATMLEYNSNCNNEVQV